MLGVIFFPLKWKMFCLFALFMSVNQEFERMWSLKLHGHLVCFVLFCHYD